MLVGCCCLQALFLDTFPSTFLCLLYADAYRVQPEALAQFSTYTAVKVSSGLGRVLPPLGLLAAAGLAGDSGAQSSLAALDAPWT